MYWSHSFGTKFLSSKNLRENTECLPSKHFNRRNTQHTVCVACLERKACHLSSWTDWCYTFMRCSDRILGMLEILESAHLHTLDHIRIHSGTHISRVHCSCSANNTLAPSSPLVATHRNICIRLGLRSNRSSSSCSTPCKLSMSSLYPHIQNRKGIRPNLQTDGIFQLLVYQIPFHSQLNLFLLQTQQILKFRRVWTEEELNSHFHHLASSQYCANHYAINPRTSKQEEVAKQK